MRLSFKEMKDAIAKLFPRTSSTMLIWKGDISIVTPTPDAFGGGDGLVGKIAKKIKRRIVLRPHESIMKGEAETEEFIRDLIEDVAGIDSIYFDACYCEVTVICNNPGEAVGRRGANAKAIRDECGWLVKFERTPPIYSKTMHDIRGYRASHAKERRKLLKDFGLNIYRPKRPGSFWVRTTALGSYREVGRACHLVTSNESRVMIDVGVNIASDTDPMPYFTPEALRWRNGCCHPNSRTLRSRWNVTSSFRYGYRDQLLYPPPLET